MTALDRAVIAYRENPTPANHAALLAAQQAHTTAFYRRETQGFQNRTH